MEFDYENVKMVDSEALARAPGGTLLRTGTPPLDEILSPGYVASPKGPQERQKAARGGGLVPGILHVLAGPQHLLSRVLMRLAVMAQLPPVDGGVGASRVFYVELNNFFDPYLVSRVAMEMERPLNPAGVLDRIDIARGFNWGQAVEIVGKALPAKVAPRSVVLVSGLTSLMDPSDAASFEGLREMVAGLKRCQQAAPVYMAATCPIADGSTYKPRGGHMLYHHAGVIVAVSGPRETRSGSTVTEWVLVRHVAFPERVLQCWDHAAAEKRATRKHAGARKGDLSTFRTLDDFTGRQRGGG
ncbi:MAG: hypothetical protein JW839_22800 [Candidatus Lokiarchaeota archaeon]|nr:hypothetical protein [Candidatus Lokiarchaeota archaeon]